MTSKNRVIFWTVEDVIKWLENILITNRAIDQVIIVSKFTE
jgi:hypothetical protein